MNRILNCSTFLALVLLPSLCTAATIIDEDFDSYADTAAVGGVWSLSDGTLDTANGNPSQSLNHPGTSGSFSGGNTNSLSFAEIAPSGAQVLTFSADIFDDASSANKRTTAGLRLAAGANIIEMGMYNSPPYYAYRVVLFGSAAPGAGGWVAFDNLVDDGGQPINNEPLQGWHRFVAEITDSQINFSLDLNSDGNINATATESIMLNAAGGFDIVRLGGPSDLSSAGGGVKFDNVSLTLVPEPASAMLALLGLVGLATRRK